MLKRRKCRDYNAGIFFLIIMNLTKHHFLWSFIFVFTVVFSTVNGQVLPDTAFNKLLRTENGGWVAGDATYSVYLPDGRTLWLFGDSFIGTVNPDSSLASGAKMIRNCAVLQDEDSMTAMYQGSFEDPDDFVLTNTPDSTWFWPDHGIVEGDTLRFIFSEFGTGDGEPGWNFEYRDAYVVNFTYPELEFVDIVLLPYYPLNGVMYGDRLMNHDGYTYIYGRKEHNPETHVPYAHIARTPIGELTGEWDFYNGSEWSDDAASSAWISFQAVSQQYGVFPHAGKFVMITQQIWLGGKIYSLTANAPEGPWGNFTELYTTPYPFEDMFTYNAYPHPQFDEDNALLISYNSNGDFWEIFNNVELYRPRFIRVPYTMIDTSFTPLSVMPTAEQNVNIVKCFPNPASDQLTVSFSISKDDFVQLKIYNLVGTEVFVSPKKWFLSGENSIEISLAGLPGGIYIYRINGLSGKFVHN